MKILIDGRSITPQISGISRYVYHLIEGYVDAYGYDSVTIVLNKPIINFPYQYIICSYNRHSLLGSLRFSFFLNKLEYDVFHSGDMTGTIWHKKGKKHIITVHDLMFLSVSEFYKSNSYKNKIRRLKNYWMFYWILRNADLRISISATTKSDLKKYYSFDSIVLREGVNEIKKAKTKMPDYQGLKKNSYFLYVGLGAPHKNIQFMVDAFLKAQTDKQLVICGKEHKQITNNRVIYTGWIEDEELDFLYQNCAAFIFPSLYEGFGLPILEALSYHCKVFSSNAGSLSEFSSKYVWFFNPYQQNELIHLIETCDHLKIDTKGIDEYLTYFDWKKIWKEFHQTYNLN